MNYKQRQLRKVYRKAFEDAESIYYDTVNIISYEEINFTHRNKLLEKISIFEQTIKRRVLKHYRENGNLDINSKEMIDKTDFSFYYREASARYAKRKGRLVKKRYGTNGYNKIIK